MSENSHQPTEFPLMSGQWGIWAAHLVDPASTAYNLGERVDVVGPIDRGAFAEAVYQVQAEADALRLTLIERDGTPRQLITREPQSELRFVDLADEPGPEAAARQWMQSEFAKVMGLLDGPLFSPALLRITKRHHVWFNHLHHIAVDAFSLPLIEKRVAALYTALVSGATPGHHGFGGYHLLSDEDTAYRGSEQYVSDQKFWRDRLVDRPEPVNLAGRWASRKQGIVSSSASLPSWLVASIREVGQEVRASRSQVLTAAIAAYLFRLTGARDLVVGQVRMCRPTAALRRIPGMVSNIIPIRIAVCLDTSPETLIRKVAAEVRVASPRERYRFEHIRRDLGILTPDMPLLSPVINFIPFNCDLDFAGLRGDADVLTSGPIDDMTVNIYARSTDAGLRLEFVGNTEVYDGDTLAEHLRRFVHFLPRFVTDRRHPVARLSVLADRERRALVARGSAPPARVRPTTLWALFAAQAARTPEATALASSIETVSFAELERRARRWGHLLQDRGVGPERIVAVLLPRSPQWVTAMLAVASAGGAALPIEGDQPAERTAAVLDDARPHAVISMVDDQGERVRIGAGVDRLVVEHQQLRPAPGVGDPATFRAAAVPLSPEHLAYVIYTSGSTGAPKGVGVSHRGLAGLAAAQADRFGLRPGVRVLFFAALGCDAAIAEVFSTLLAGGTLVVPGAREHLPGAGLAEFVADHHVTHATIPPSVLAGMTPAGYPGLGTLIVAGEACPPAVVAAWAPVRCMINAYGPTESTVCVTISGPLSGNGTPSIGRPIPGVSAYVLDSCLQPCPEEVPGELYLAGPGLARGYLRRAALTASHFVADPFGPGGGRMYRTGDRVCWRPDGGLDYLGRLDSQVNIHGFRVEPTEVEAILTDHPAVAAAAVLAHSDGVGAPRLIAYLAAAQDRDLDVAELRHHTRARLPRHMVPAVFLTLDQLPLTTNGKIDRSALPAPPAPTGELAEGSPQEQILCGLFAKLLEAASVSAHDDFFALGGNSLLATRLVNGVRATFGAELSVRDVFDAPTPAQLSERLDGGVARPALRPAARPEQVPLSYAQRRLWFLHRMEGPSATYNMPIVIRLSGELDRQALRQALHDVLARHESLRTVYPEVDGEPRQVVVDLDSAAPVLALSRVSATELPGVLDAAAWYAFDLTREVPVRAELFAVHGGEHVLLLLIHHIAGDGWSLAPLCRDLAAAYRARRSGAAPSWPPLPVQYVDYTLWHHRLLGDADDADSVHHRQLDYWTRTLADLPEQLPLPTDRVRPAVSSHRGGVVSFALDARLHRELLNLARKHDVTLFMVLHAALAALLTRLGAGTDLPLGSAVAGRTDLALDDLVGFFVNTLVLRTDTSGDPTFTKLLTRLRETDLAAYAHQDVPLNTVVEAVNPVRSAAQQPLFQVMLVLQNIPEIRLDLPDVRAELEPRYLDVAKLDLAFSFIERRTEDGAAAGLAATAEYSSDLFDRVTGQQCAERLVGVLAAMVTDPDRRIGELDVLVPGERTRLLEQWGSSPTRVEPVTVPELFDAVVRSHPEAVAVCSQTESVCYAELDRRADQLARRLRGRGVGPEQVAAVLLPRSIDWVVAVLAVAKAGGAFLPLDPTIPARRIDTLLADVGPRTVVTDTDLVTHLPGLGRYEPLVVDRPPSRDEPQATAGSAELLVDNAAYLIFTSGSTGAPKGVVVTQRGIAGLVTAYAEHLGIGPGSRVLQFAALGFDAVVAEVFSTLLNGATLVLPPGTRPPLGPELSDVIDRHHVTHLLVLPSALATLRPDQLPTVHTLAVVGEACPPATASAWATGRRLINAYGPTETTVCATLSEPLTGQDRPPIGRPIHHLRAYVLDPRLRPCPTGVPGELYLGGAGLARCYAGRRALTAERFVADPFTADGQRMYRTGDVARWRQDGQLDHVGRADRQVKIRGVRVEPGEVEATLLRHPEVAQAAVITRDDPVVGPQLIAYVAPTPRSARRGQGATDEVDEWRQFNDSLYSTGDHGAWGEDFAGWVSSYDGKPIPLPAMREWRATTVEALRALTPRRVLEIGVGSGLLLAALAPECTEYWGSDISAAAIDRLRAHLARRPELAARARLRTAPADDVDGLPAGFFDLVILNSTIQYFPDTEYLEQVLRRALALLAPGGRVFLGDVRNLRTLHLLHTGVELHHRSRHREPLVIRRAVQDRIAWEKELLFDPDYFAQLPTTISAIADVDIRLRRGRRHTELTRHRYDVVLHAQPGAKDGAARSEAELVWGSDVDEATEVADLLADRRPERLRLVNVPNARLAGEAAAVRALAEEQDHASVLRWLHDPPQPGVDPETWHEFGARLGYQVATTWNGACSDGGVDVVFSTERHPLHPGELYRPAPPGLTPPRQANDPAAAQRARQVAGTLRDYLRERLPEHMVPTTVVGLERLPFTANGKLDRTALPAPQRDGPTPGRQARTPQERTLCRLFGEALGRSDVGIDANFFDLGGHSLLATWLVNRINQELGSALPLAAVFDAPTVAGLSGLLHHAGQPRLAGQTGPQLRAEVMLDPTASTERSRPHLVERTVDPKHVLLTGATGFLGSFLLAELLRKTRATVLCLVRAADAASAGRRLRKALKRYRLWDEIPAERIIPVVGDLEQPRLGLTPQLFDQLAEQVDVIHHNGSWVHTLHPYQRLRAANVGGTHEVLRLAATSRVSPVHYMSTLGAAVAAEGSTTTVREDHRLPAESVNPNGYVSSKWVAEEMVYAARERGVPTTVFRPGRVSGHSSSGAGGTNDAFWLMVRTMLELGAAPHFAGNHTGIELDLVPVDYVTRAAVELASRPRSAGNTYHLSNARLVPLDAVLQSLRKAGYHIDAVSPDDWSTRLDARLAPAVSPDADPIQLAALFGRLIPTLRAASVLRFDASNTERDLAGSAIHCSEVDDDVLGRYIAYFINSGFFPSPDATLRRRQ